MNARLARAEVRGRKRRVRPGPAVTPFVQYFFQRIEAVPENVVPIKDPLHLVTILSILSHSHLSPLDLETSLLLSLSSLPKDGIRNSNFGRFSFNLEFGTNLGICGDAFCIFDALKRIHLQMPGRFDDGGIIAHNWFGVRLGFGNEFR
jgi:hypothetical protein